MTTSLTPPQERDLTDGRAPELRCAACDHELARHDPVGLRYCQATEAQGRSRNCICRSQ
jgi:hypothetical protein